MVSANPHKSHRPSRLTADFGHQRGPKGITRRFTRDNVNEGPFRHRLDVRLGRNAEDKDASAISLANDLKAFEDQ